MSILKQKKIIIEINFFFNCYDQIIKQKYLFHLNDSFVMIFLKILNLYFIIIF